MVGYFKDCAFSFWKFQPFQIAWQGFISVFEGLGKNKWYHFFLQF
jgi:hypothetical protein